MIFFGKVLVIVLVVLQIVQIFCFPHFYGWSDLGGTCPSNKILSNTLQSNQIVNIEPICRKFHFPETEYPLASMSDIPLNFQEIEKKTCVKTKMNIDSHFKSDSKKYLNINYNNDHDMKSLCSRHTREFPSLSSHCDSGNFPDIEYPMSASELWKPYYWSCQNNFQSLYSDQPVVSSKLNHTLACKKVTNRLEKLSRHITTNPVSIKSYSAPQKNLIVKNNGQDKNINLQNHNDSKKLIRNKEVICKTTESQLTPFNKSRNIHPDYHNIDLNDHKHIEPNIVIDSPPTYLKNYGDDSSYFSPIENDITLYANELNNKMTSITKSVTDNICLKNTKLPNMKINTDASDPKEHFTSDCEETVKYMEKCINTYADRFNDEMSSILSSNFEHNILNDLNYMEESFSADGKVIPVKYITDMTADRNLLEKNPLHSKICCVRKDEEICRTTDFGSELLNETLTKKNSDKKYAIDDSNIKSDKEIPNDIVEIKYNSNEDYTTDVYPETETFYLQSTVAPQISLLDTTWKSSQVIEPDKDFGSDELGQYFMLV